MLVQMDDHGSPLCPVFYFFFKFSAILIPLQLFCGTCSSFHLCIFINSVTCHFLLLLVLLVCIVIFKFSKHPFLMYPQNFICHFLIGCNTCFLVLKNYISEPLTTLLFFFSKPASAVCSNVIVFVYILNIMQCTSVHILKYLQCKYN